MMDARRALYLAAAFTELAGLLMVVGAVIPGLLDPLVSFLFAEPVTLGPPARLGAGIAGALMTGWASTLAYLLRKIDDLSAHTLGSAVALGVVVWFVLDGVVSIANGAALNVVGNLLFLVILLLPALKLREPAGWRRTA